MKKTLFAVVFAFMSVATAFAVPAKPGVRLYTQPDGSQISIEVFGDEHFHYTTTADGYLVENVNGRYEYAECEANGTIKTLGIAAQNPEFRPDDVVSRLVAVGKFALDAETFHKLRMESPRMMEAQPGRAQKVGERGLVILVNFKDAKFSHTREEFDAMLNSENYTLNGSTGSAHDYFKTASNGQYNPKFDIYGPYTLENPYRFYGANTSGKGTDGKPEQMVVDAMNRLDDDAEAEVNFADYDTDGDGNIDNVFIYYAGYGENQTGEANRIWPHRFRVVKEKVNDYRDSYDGKILYDYACTCELSGTEGTEICGIGTFCHEFSHVLGLPDLYDTNYQGYKTVGDWDLMDSGSYNNDEDTPPTYSASERFFVGWLTPILLNDYMNIELVELQESNTAYVITNKGEFNPDPKDEKQEFYILENRQNKGWDAHLPGHGMLITRFHYNESFWKKNIVNNNSENMRVDLIEADGINGILTAEQGSQGKPGDAFPGSANVTSYSPYKNMDITNIREEGEVIKFTFGTPGVAVDDETAYAPALIRNADNTTSLINIPVGARISCIDFTGRTLWSGETETSTVELPDFNTRYMVRISYGDEIITLKNI